MTRAEDLPLHHPPLVPELQLHVAHDLVDTWESFGGDDPPFWAHPWPGGQAVARWLLDHPEVVRGRRVVDFAAGSGLVALAAAAGGAAAVVAVDLDPAAGTALAANAAANRWAWAELPGGIAFCGQDPLGGDPPDADVVCAGDVCYTAELARRALAWLAASAAGGASVLVGDPGRRFFPTSGRVRPDHAEPHGARPDHAEPDRSASGSAARRPDREWHLELLAGYDIPSDPAIEGTDVSHSAVYRLRGS